MTSPKATRISLAQALLLSLGVPLVLLGACELVARALNTPQWFSSASAPQMLEMPTWMSKDDNRIAAAGRVATDKSTLEWLSLFKEGDGFRVSLIPGVSTRVKNTFAQIEAEKRDGFEIRANSLGFRSPEPAPEASFKIVVYGDSSSFGWGVEERDRFDHILIDELTKRNPGIKYSLLNFAVPGDSSEYGRLVFDHFAAKYPADLVILGFGANDAKPVVTSHQLQVDRFKQALWMQELKRSLDASYLFRTMRLALESAANKQVADASVVPHKPAVDGARYRTNLAHMLAESYALGAGQGLVLTMCTPGDYAKKARKAAQKNGAMFFNGQTEIKRLLPEIKTGKLHPELVAEMQSRYPKELRQNDLWYISSDACHPNKLGHRIIGEALAQLISQAH